MVAHRSSTQGDQLTPLCVMTDKETCVMSNFSANSELFCHAENLEQSLVNSFRSQRLRFYQ